MSGKRAKAARRVTPKTSSSVVHITAGYEAAQWSPNRAPISHVVQDASKDLTPQVLRELRKNSRYLDCNSPVYSGAVKRLVTLIVGTGIMASSASASTEWGKRATKAYAIWGKKCDVAQVSTISALQQMLAHSLIVDGEVFKLKTRNDEGGEARVQILEAHQIEDIKFNDVGRPLYYIPAGTKKVKEGEISPDWYPADQVTHYFRQIRPGQRRGVPLFASAINTSRAVESIVNLELAASIAAGKTVEVVNRKGGVLPKTPQVAASLQKTSVTGRPDTYYQDIVGPTGLVLDLDEKYEQVVSQRPSTAWQGFIDFLLNIFCLAGDLPPSGFLQIKVGGADTRRDLESAQRVVEQWQQLIADGEQDTWEYFVENSKDLAEGKPEDWREVAFQYPRKLTVDDGRNSAGDRADMASGMITVDEYCARYGASGAEHVRQLKADMREVNPSLTDAQINAMLLKRLFGVDAVAVTEKSPSDQKSTQPDSSTPTDQKDAAQSGDLQAAALNGAQVQSLVELALKVASGELPRESAAAIAGAAFPLIPAAVIARIFDGITAKSQAMQQTP